MLSSLRHVVLPLLACAAPLFAQVREAASVPVNRLLTDGELLDLADLPPSVQRLRETENDAAALQLFVSQLAERRTPAYFVPASQVALRVEQFQRRYPETAARAVRQAEEFIETFGADVDWRVPGKDRLGKPHTPNTVRLLARQWQAENIALRYYLNGRDRSSIDFLTAHVRDFVADFEQGRTETGGNDIFERFYAGHRTRNWIMAHYLLLGTNDYRADDQALMLKVFLLHAAKLYEGCRKFNWGNHQLVGLTGLFEVSLMYPEFPVMRALNRHALQLIIEHLTKEIASDGFQFERASHYFKLDIVNYFRVYRLAQLNRIELPPLFHERFRKMFDAIVLLATPTRSLPVLQDAQDTYLTGAGADEARTGVGEARSSNAAELAEPQEDVFMALGAVLFNEPSFKYFAREAFPPAFFWFMDSTAADRYAIIPSIRPTVGSVALPETKYYVMRSGWNPDDRYMIIDGGLAHDKPDHTHGGILGVAMSAYGRELLPTYRVRYSEPSYPFLKNSLAKNVALADTLLQGRGWKPNAAGTGFGIWRSLPAPTVEAWWTGGEFDYFRGSHNGFDTLGVRYSRSILFVRPAYWVVWDRFDSGMPHTAQQIWQGRYMLSDGGRAVQRSENASLTLLQADTVGLAASLHSHERTSSVWFERQAAQAHTFMTFVLPDSSSASESPALSHRELEGVTVTALRMNGIDDRFYVGKGAEWSDEALATDARLAVIRMKDDRAYSCVFTDARTIQWGKQRMDCSNPCTLEWKQTKGGLWRVKCLSGTSGSATLHAASGLSSQICVEPGKEFDLP